MPFLTPFSSEEMGFTNLSFLSCSGKAALFLAILYAFEVFLYVYAG
jgi:hypothetical protein